jgi:hypothetical protein
MTNAIAIKGAQLLLNLCSYNRLDEEVTQHTTLALRVHDLQRTWDTGQN